MNKPNKQGHQEGWKGVRWLIVPMKPGNAGGGKGPRLQCSCKGNIGIAQNIHKL